MNYKDIEHITKMTFESQNQKLRLFARIDLDTKLAILKYQKSLFHKIKTLYLDTNNDMLTLASLILSIDTIINKFDNISLNANKFKVKSYRTNIKKERLIGHWAIIKTLKIEQHMSFRNIAKYLKKYHKLDIAHSTVYSLWSELEQNNSKGEF